MDVFGEIGILMWGLLVDCFFCVGTINMNMLTLDYVTVSVNFFLVSES